jgi:hypothetical protein
MEKFIEIEEFYNSQKEKLSQVEIDELNSEVLILKNQLEENLKSTN